MEIKTKVDLYSTKTRNRQGEQFAIYEMLGQIRGWLKDNSLEFGIFNNRASSILLNKLIYYSSSKIEDVNKKFFISKGWYKYGPCFDLGRTSEESLSLELFKKLTPKANLDIIPEIKETCEEHIPIFLDSIKGNQFPNEYLKYIYEKKWEYPWLKDYYINKNELEMLIKKKRKNYTKDEINNIFLKFDLSVTDSDYLKKVGISETVIDKIIMFNALLNDLYMKQNELNADLFESMKIYLTENIYMIFAYKNYKTTFKTPNQTKKKIVKGNMEYNYNLFKRELEQKIDLYYSLIT